MKVIWTKQDRKEYQKHAWAMVKGINAPRHVRLMLRDQIMKDTMARAAQEIEGENADTLRA